MTVDQSNLSVMLYGAEDLRLVIMQNFKQYLNIDAFLQEKIPIESPNPGGMPINNQ
jgi:hypothetical protein